MNWVVAHPIGRCDEHGQPSHVAVDGTRVIGEVHPSMNLAGMWLAVISPPDHEELGVYTEHLAAMQAVEEYWERQLRVNTLLAPESKPGVADELSTLGALLDSPLASGSSMEDLAHGLIVRAMASTGATFPFDRDTNVRVFGMIQDAMAAASRRIAENYRG